MFIQKLDLQNFRNYSKKSFDFSSNTTLIVGPNASGKTNILEAIYLLSRGKSFRADLDREMIRYGEEVARVEGIISDERRITEGTEKDRRHRELSAFSDRSVPSVIREISDSNKTLEVILTTGQVQGKKTRGKLFKVNGVGRRWWDFVGNLKVVIFRPEDIEIVLGSPSLRRDYLDSVLEQVDLDYRRASLIYKKGLKQRNRLLDMIREGQARPTQLEFWNRLLVKNGEIISRKREELIEFVNSYWGDWGHLGNLGIIYEKSVISPARLEKYAQAELVLGATLVGPQRDEIKFSIFNFQFSMKRDLALFGSRGEQRMAILALKLAELEFVSQKALKNTEGTESSRPILLLDDIFSELDSKNRQAVLSTIPCQQTIITTTDPNLVEKKFLDRIVISNL